MDARTGDAGAMNFRFEKCELHRQSSWVPIPPECYANLLRNNAGLLQCRVSAVFVDRLKTARRHANTHKLLQFRHPNALVVQIGSENARYVFCYVPADSTLFLGHAASMNDAASRRSRSCDATNF